MPLTLAISTPDVVSTTSRTFPKQGMFNLKITRNGVFDTVELWVRCLAADITLELAGASFQSTAQVALSRTVPLTPTVISGSTLALTLGVTQYMKIKLNKGVSVAHLRCSYAAKTTNTTVSGGNISGQAFVDYGKKPYISTNMEKMFTTHPVRFDLTKWDMSSVTSLVEMFLNNITFNQPIGIWNVSNVTNMLDTFRNAYSFNQPIGDWDVSKVTTMHQTFMGASSFNQPIGNWNVSKVTTMVGLFNGASSFNQPIGDWNVSSVTNISEAFRNASSFNQPIGNWNLGSLTTMVRTFMGASSFNQPIGNWNVGNVTTMTEMFKGASSFNQPIGNWNVSSVTNMTRMFDGASSFNQDLSSWAAKFNVNVNLDWFFGNITWSTANYDKFLNALWTDINTTRPQAWASRTVPKLLGMGTSKYSAASAAARASLVSNGWTLTDGGLAA